VSHAYEHPPSSHTAWAWGTVTEHAVPHDEQLNGSLLVFEQVPLQFIGDAEGQLDAQTNDPPLPGAQRVALPPQATPQLPQFEAAEGLRHPPSQERSPCRQPLAMPPSPAASPLPASPACELSIVASAGVPPAASVPESAGAIFQSSFKRAGHPLSVTRSNAAQRTAKERTAIRTCPKRPPKWAQTTAKSRARRSWAP
jgi:hypothetical protein